MLKFVVLFCVAFSIVSAPVLAGSSSANFNVGVTIGPSAKRLAHKAKVQKLTKAYSTYTWGAASISATKLGFANIQPLKKSRKFYWFSAKRRGHQFRIAVSIRYGRVLKIRRG